MTATSIWVPAQRGRTRLVGRRRPLLSGHLYLEALYAAYDQCECTAWCGREHRTGDGQCPRRHEVEAPLHVIPGDPQADARRVVDVAQVLVVCASCHERRGETERLQVFEQGVRGDG